MRLLCFSIFPSSMFWLQLSSQTPGNDLWEHDESEDQTDTKMSVITLTVGPISTVLMPQATSKFRVNLQVEWDLLHDLTHTHTQGSFQSEGDISTAQTDSSDQSRYKRSKWMEIQWEEQQEIVSRVGWRRSVVTVKAALGLDLPWESHSRGRWQFDRLCHC